MRGAVRTLLRPCLRAALAVCRSQSASQSRCPWTCFWAVSSRRVPCLRAEAAARLTRCVPGAQIANEVEGAPESWLMWGGIWKLLLGKKRHANWHWADASRPRPSPMTMFILRSQNPAWFEVLGWRLEESPLRPFMRLIALGYEFEAWLELPQTLWGVLLFLPRLVIALGRLILRRPASEEEEEEEGSEESAETAGRHERLRKRLCAAAGLFGIYLTWTIFSWCAGLCMHALHRNAADTASCMTHLRFIFTCASLVSMRAHRVHAS